jgi:hypothetical protein
MAGKPSARKAGKPTAKKTGKKITGKSGKSAEESTARPAKRPAPRSAQDAPSVYQLHISIAGIEPMIWRRIQMPQKSTFWDLHVAIQNAMGWSNSHSHEFRVDDPRTGAEVQIGVPDEEDLREATTTLPGWEVPLSRYLDGEQRSARYTYDFGDEWQHDILLESLESGERGVRYPRCIDGERACPPEDCGGPPGYEEVVSALLDPDDEEHASTLEWVGADYDPSLFEPENVRFEDPRQRWRVTFEDAEEELDEETLAAEDDADTAKMLRGGIRKAVSEQLRAGDPPETRATFERLLAAGIAREEVWRLLSCVLATEMFEIAREQREYDHDRYVAMLNALPTLPFD